MDHEEETKMENKELSNKELDAVSGGSGSDAGRKLVVARTTSIFSAPHESTLSCIGTIQEGTHIDAYYAGSRWYMFTLQHDPGITLNSNAIKVHGDAFIKASDVKREFLTISN